MASGIRRSIAARWSTFLRATGFLGLGAVLALPALAQPQEWPANRNLIIPQSRVIVPPDCEKPIKLSVVKADIAIVEQVATTTLRMTLMNPSSRVQEAEIIAPVPDGAAVKFFQLEGVGSDGGARLLPRDEARRIYEDIVRRMQDPAILEFAGYGFIRSNVFPVPAGGTQTITLAYEQLLPADGARVDFLLPKTQSLESTGIEWSIDMTVHSTRPIATIYSATHDLAISGAGSTRAVRVNNPMEPGSFAASIMYADHGGLAASLLAYPDPKVAQDGRGGYFMLLAALPPLDPAERTAIKREVTVVFDRSGSMRGEKIEQAKAAVLQVIEALSPGEYFNIIDYSDNIQTFSPRPVARSDETIRQAREYVGNIQAIGGTNIHDALVEALRQPPTAGTLPVVLFLTDGLPTIGQTRESAIREAAEKGNQHGRRIFTFGVGFDVNAPMLTAIARQSRATSTFVAPEEDVEVKVGSVFADLAGPVLSSPRLTVLAADGSVDTRRTRDLMPAELPDIFDGDQLSVLGQYLGEEPLRVRLEGNFLGAPRSFDFSFALDRASARHSFVPRLWATRKIGALIEQIRLAGADSGLPTNRPRPVDPKFQELVDEIVRLSTEFGVLTEYTAFLADEDAMTAGFPLEAPAVQQQAMRTLRERAMEDRAGAGGVNQELNLNEYAYSGQPRTKSGYLDEDMQWVDLLGCQVAGDKALFKRGYAWIDGRLMDRDLRNPDETVDFGTDRYFEIVRRLATENRQSLISNRGDSYVELEGKCLLVRNPS